MIDKADLTRRMEEAASDRSPRGHELWARLALIAAVIDVKEQVLGVCLGVIGSLLGVAIFQGVLWCLRSLLT